MTIQEQIYNRFITATCRLKEVTSISDSLLKELVNTYLDKQISSTIQFSIKLKEEEFLVNTAIITALMEVSDTWQQFEQLQEKQKQIADNNVAPPEKELSNFDKVLKGMLNVPPPKKKTKKK
jgi:hypothetical protein